MPLIIVVLPYFRKRSNIPAGTPFVLKSPAWTDADGNGISYSWEQVNANASTAGGVALGGDDGIGALIRVARAVDVNGLISFRPERTIPAMSLLLRPNPLATDVELRGEQIPRASTVGALNPYAVRSLRFRLVGRDNRGGVAQAEMNLTVRRMGQSFAVLKPTTSSLLPNQVVAVEWRIAGTNNASVYNCPSLDVEYTNNGGTSFVKLKSVANTEAVVGSGIGKASITLPSTINSNLRTHIRLKCSNDSNIFFAVSAQNPHIYAR